MKHRRALFSERLPQMHIFSQFWNHFSLQGAFRQLCGTFFPVAEPSHCISIRGARVSPFLARIRNRSGQKSPGCRTRVWPTEAATAAHDLRAAQQLLPVARTRVH